ncbi:MAG: hypothetical protein ACYDBP_04500 [Leptospirales bacterium]
MNKKKSKTIAVFVRIDETLHCWLTREASKQKMSVPVFVKTCLNRQRKKEKLSIGPLDRQEIADRLLAAKKILGEISEGCGLDNKGSTRRTQDQRKADQ